MNQQQKSNNNKMKGRLAEVSIYEFVNDWIRPEISWQIFRYAMPKDPHKQGMLIAQNYRTEFVSTGRGWSPSERAKQPGRYKMMGGRPYNRVAVFKGKRFNQDDDTIKEYNGEWAHGRCQGLDSWNVGFSRIVYSVRTSHLTYTNRILSDLIRASYCAVKYPLAEMLKKYKVKGRTKLLKAFKPKSTMTRVEMDEFIQARNNIIHALIKCEPTCECADLTEPRHY